MNSSPDIERTAELVDRQQYLQSLSDSVPVWFHSIELGKGIITPGYRSYGALAFEYNTLRLPSLQGKSVLDIGAYDGFFSFEAERHGPSRVVALDHYVWSYDIATYERIVAESRAHGRVPPPPENTVAWDPSRMPGKRGFDTAKRALGSHVESIADDFTMMDLDALGKFDIVLYLGVLYHMRDPLTSLCRLATVTSELAVIETQGIVVSGLEERSICEFYPADELHGDPTNWWAPNGAALIGMCRAAGFRSAEIVATVRDSASGGQPSVIERCRLIVHARR